MNLENRIYLYDRKANSPSLNLAINRLIIDAIKEGRYDAVARVYHHTNGIILGNGESVEDVNTDYCRLNNFEIVTRPSGGSAILVMPDLNLCYSVFANLSTVGMSRDVTKIYKSLVLPLAQKLGAVVEGIYYMKIKTESGNIPFAGHAMKLEKDAMQFDGVVQKTRFDMNILEQAINLRHLYKLNGANYIEMNGRMYDKYGKETEINLNEARLLRKEYDELSKTVGLSELGLSDETFVSHLFSVLSDIFPGIRETSSMNLGYSKTKKYKKELEQLNKGKRVALGHCFVDFMEPEPLLLEEVYVI